MIHIVEPVYGDIMEKEWDCYEKRAIARMPIALWGWVVEKLLFIHLLNFIEE
jgi:hypothetical protein